MHVSDVPSTAKEWRVLLDALPEGSMARTLARTPGALYKGEGECENGQYRDFEGQVQLFESLLKIAEAKEPAHAPKR